MPYIDVAAATNGFTSYLGRGGFATVYLGQMHLKTRKRSPGAGADSGTGMTVAVKKEIVFEDGGGGAVSKGERFVDGQFLMEVLVLYQCRHPNICNLVGHSIDGPARCLIYEFCGNGCLQGLLRKPLEEGSPKPSSLPPSPSTHNMPVELPGMPPLTWSQRLKLSVDCARGVNYLHTQLPAWVGAVIHRDIKAANILVDENCRAKLCDFGSVQLMKTDFHSPEPIRRRLSRSLTVEGQEGENGEGEKKQTPRLVNPTGLATAVASVSVATPMSLSSVSFTLASLPSRSRSARMPTCRLNVR
jgi:serine/threonine protein kinase